MVIERPQRILTLNSGSSSIKFALYLMGSSEELVLSGILQRIGLEDGVFQARQPDGAILVERRLKMPNHATALDALFAWLRQPDTAGEPDAVGHRVVHGGPRYSVPEPVTAELIAALKTFMPLAPSHLPHELEAIEAVSRLYPDLPQVACFDTGFHYHMPRLAQMLPLPRCLWEEGVRRYGFHGLSYEYVLQELARESGGRAVNGRVIIAHFGNGVSMAAVKDGRCVDTTMGFTPTAGLMMSTRTGDLDPGVMLYLFEEKRLTASQVRDVVNRQSGLLGVSALSPDMRDLLDQEAGDRRAAEAVELFCYQARKFLGALAAVLGGLDMLVFTGGIGENAPAIRWRMCRNMEFVGIRLDAALNQMNAPAISRDDSSVVVRVIRTNEELMIARHTCEALSTARSEAALDLAIRAL